MHVQGFLIGTCPTVMMSIGGVTVECILDTGSMVSLITDTFYTEYLRNIYFVRERHLKMRVANGLDISYVVYTETSVYIKSVKLLLKKGRILIEKDTQGREVNGLLSRNE